MGCVRSFQGLCARVTSGRVRGVRWIHGQSSPSLDRTQVALARRLLDGRARLHSRFPPQRSPPTRCRSRSTTRPTVSRPRCTSRRLPQRRTQLFITYKKSTSSAVCTPTASADKGTKIDYSPAIPAGTGTVAIPYTFKVTGSYLFCSWLAPSSTSSATASAAQAISIRNLSAKLSISASPTQPITGNSVTITMSGNDEVTQPLYARARLLPASGGSCAVDGERGQGQLAQRQRDARAWHVLPDLQDVVLERRLVARVRLADELELVDPARRGLARRVRAEPGRDAEPQRRPAGRRTGRIARDRQGDGHLGVRPHPVPAHPPR